MVKCSILLSATLAASVQAATITVDEQQRYQSFDGIGVAEAFQRSLVLHELNTPSQNLALDYLFSSTKGAGLTILRNGLGSSPDDPFDLMESIAPVAPTSNSSQVFHASEMCCLWRLLTSILLAQLHPPSTTRSISSLALPSGCCQRREAHLR